MKFLIQKCNGNVTHDFSFTLLESIRFKNWLLHLEKDNIKVKFLNTDCNVETIDPSIFKPMHFTYVPIGSVEFVTAFLQHFYNLTPKPINVPEELFCYTERIIFNGNQSSLDGFDGEYFVKSNDKIKGYSAIINTNKEFKPLPEGNYQISKYINIDSEWRAFVYQNKLVGLQNYCGEFTKFPNINKIRSMIKKYKSAPIAYTLDVGVNDKDGTFIIEIHTFFSCGLYGFVNHAILPNMFYQCFQEYIQKEK